jgi:hypothetical protein
LVRATELLAVRWIYTVGLARLTRVATSLLQLALALLSAEVCLSRLEEVLVAKLDPSISLLVPPLRPCLEATYSWRVVMLQLVLLVPSDWLAARALKALPVVFRSAQPMLLLDRTLGIFP